MSTSKITKELSTKWFVKKPIYSDTFGGGGRDFIRLSSLSIWCSLIMCLTSEFLCRYVALQSEHFINLPSVLSLGTSADFWPFGISWLTSEEDFRARLHSGCLVSMCATTLKLQGEKKIVRWKNTVALCLMYLCPLYEGTNGHRKTSRGRLKEVSIKN